MAFFAAAGLALSAISTAKGFSDSKKADKANRAAAIAEAESRRRRAEAGARRSESDARMEEYNAEVAANNEALALFMAQDERDVARVAESNHRLKIAGIVGQARARLGASGFAADAGDAPLLIGDTAAVGDVEARTIRRGGEIRAIGREFEAVNFGIEREQRLESAKALRVERDAFIEEAESIRVPDAGGSSDIFGALGSIVSLGSKAADLFKGSGGGSVTPDFMGFE